MIYDYVHLLVEARHNPDAEVTIPRALYVDLLQRVCSPLAPSTRHPYPLPNPHTDPPPPSPGPVDPRLPFAKALKKFDP